LNFLHGTARKTPAATSAPAAFRSCRPAAINCLATDLVSGRLVFPASIRSHSGCTRGTANRRPRAARPSDAQQRDKLPATIAVVPYSSMASTAPLPCFDGRSVRRRSPASCMRGKPTGSAAIRSAVGTRAAPGWRKLCRASARREARHQHGGARVQPTAARHSCGMLTCSPVTRPEL
jgi:hypothetical protein